MEFVPIKQKVFWVILAMFQWYGVIRMTIDPWYDDMDFWLFLMNFIFTVLITFVAVLSLRVPSPKKPSADENQALANWVSAQGYVQFYGEVKVDHDFKTIAFKVGETPFSYPLDPVESGQFENFEWQRFEASMVLKTYRTNFPSLMVVKYLKGNEGYIYYILQ